MGDNMTIRVNDEIKEKFNELAAASEFDNKGEFLENLLLVYQSETTKREVPVLKDAIIATQSFMWKLTDVLTGVGATITIDTENRKKEMENNKASYEELRALLEQRLATLQGNLVESEERAAAILSEKQALDEKVTTLEEQMKNVTEAHQQQIRQLDNSLNDKNLLISELKIKNETLNGIVEESKKAANENKAILGEFQILKLENDELQKQAQEFEHEKERMEESFSKEKENLIATLQLKKERELLEMDKANNLTVQQYQKKLDDTISLYHDKIKELLELTGQKNHKEKNQGNPT